MANDPHSRPRVRWLNRDEQRTWRAFRRAGTLVDAAVDAHLQRISGLRTGHYLIVAMLSEAPHRQLRMTELAVRAQSSRSALSHAVARLEARGWVERRGCVTDGRGQMAILTDAGLDAVRAIAPAHVDRVRSAMFDALTAAEVVLLGRLCERIAASVERELLIDGSRDRPTSGLTG
jgi:DNA-binding MarR family transcriptional regulator